MPGRPTGWLRRGCQPQSLFLIVIVKYCELYIGQSLAQQLLAPLLGSGSLAGRARTLHSHVAAMIIALLLEK